MKTCLYCGKTLTSEQRHNKYCSTKCHKEHQAEQKIIAWKEKRYNGYGQNGDLSSTIRKYLIKEANNQCELCGWNKINSTTNLVPLEIHHIDGNYLNNQPENLQVLCPNCHSLTSNFKSLNDSNRARTVTRKNYCIDCGIEISSSSLRCRSCADKSKITEKPISRKELKQLIRTTPFTQIGKQFNVSDNAIKKWCIQYNLPSKKKDIKLYSDEEWELI